MYLATIAPTIFHQDSPEFVNTAFTLGISHPAGFPTYNLLAKAVTFFPLGSIAFKVNLFSTVAACLSIVFLYLAGIRLLRILFGPQNPERFFWPAFIATGYLAFCGTFWFNSIQAEVYTLHTLFTCLIIWLLLVWGEGRDVRYLFLAALAYGLSAGNHATVAFYLPAILLLFFCWNKENKLKNLTLCVCFFLVGLSVYLYLPIRSWAEPSFDWGNPETLKGFLYQVTDRKDAHSHFSHLRQASGGTSSIATAAPIVETAWKTLENFFGEMWQPVRVFLVDIQNNLSPVSAVGYIAGALICLRASLPLFFFFLIIVGVNIVFFIHWRGESFLPSYITATLFTAAFIHFVLARLDTLRNKKFSDPSSIPAQVNWRKIILTSFILLIPWLALVNFFKVDRSDIYHGESLYQRIYLTLEDRSIFIPGISWFHYYYYQDVVRLRDDVTSVSVWDLMNPDPPSMLTDRRYPDLKLPEASRYDFKSEEIISSYIKEFFEINYPHRPILLEQCWTFYEHTLLTGNMVPFRNILLKYSSEEEMEGPSVSERKVFDEYKLFLEDALSEMNTNVDKDWINNPAFFLDSFSMYFHDTGRYLEEREVLVVIANFLGKKFTAEWNFKLLDNLVHDDRILEAEKTMDFLSANFPGEYETLLGKGLVQRAQGNLEGSLLSLGNVVRKFPDEFRPRFELAITRQSQGDRQKAEKEFQAAWKRIKNLRDLATIRKVLPVNSSFNLTRSGSPMR